MRTSNPHEALRAAWSTPARRKFPLACELRAGPSGKRRLRAKRSSVFVTGRARHSSLTSGAWSFCSLCLWVRFFLRFAFG